MGTDIVMYAERRRGPAWDLCSGFTATPSVCLPAPLPTGTMVPKSIYPVRDYSLFAILGNVRNPTHSATPYEPISMPRGLPDNLSDQLRAWAARWAQLELPSWLLLSELEAFPWNDRRIVREAMVAQPAAHLFHDDSSPFPPPAAWPPGEPIGYSGWKRDGVTVRWTETYAESVGKAFFETMDRLKAYGPADDVRIVFWFFS